MNKETQEVQGINAIKEVCFGEILRQKTIIFNECVMPNQRTTVDGEVIELRPITYIDLPISSPSYINVVSDFIYSLKGQVGFDALCGVATQGVPYAFATSLKYDTPAIYYRKERQQYGTLSHLSGKLEKGSRVLIVDNLIYSGNTIVSAQEALEEAGLEVAGAFAVVNFDTAIDRLSAVRNLHHLMTVGELYEYLFKHDYFPKPIAPYIRSFIQDQTLFHSESDLYRQYLSKFEKIKKSL